MKKGPTFQDAFLLEKYCRIQIPTQRIPTKADSELGYFIPVYFQSVNVDIRYGVVKLSTVSRDEPV